mmetsp:Transcript_23195/g.60383  ORF Transcript_23195/g.60383 Transcript_23195/m.60383 type:complete len:124 (+) Transcript_23195:1261-1632(+)
MRASTSMSVSSIVERRRVTGRRTYRGRATRARTDPHAKAASTCKASGARGAAAALPIKAASKRSGMLARFAILRLQLVLEGEPGPQRRVRRTPTLLQAWNAVLLQELPLRSALRSRDPSSIYL